tara:strand:- start:527 stop:1474 length:948 start_codon:yes stop_codon:yes gene_type:complete
MKIDERKFPILAFIDKNKLTEKGFKSMEDAEEIEESFEFFRDKILQINYISSTIHDKLSDTTNFVKAKSLLPNSKETSGLILLPETIYPDFSKVQEYGEPNEKEYPINAILYSWLSANNHDKISNKSQLEDLQKRINSGEKEPAGANWKSLMESLQNEDEEWDEEQRTLLIIPIYNNRITSATDDFYLISEDEMYGEDYAEQQGEDWYGKIHDYVMSFLLFYNFTETEIQIMHGKDTGKQRRIKLEDEKFINESKNDIEIIDLTYFTKIIRTGEFGVSGHFKVQHYGVGNNESKIIYVDNYQKNGYTRGAKIDRK